ncbi:hypothetical protein CRUP_003548, partial [Coryphaenoides rupestris]
LAVLESRGGKLLGDREAEGPLSQDLDTEEEEQEEGEGVEEQWVEAEEPPRRRRSIQEGLSLPVPVCYPRNGQREEPAERSKAEFSSSPSHRDSMESWGSPSLLSPKDTPSPPSPSGFLRNVKKRESKGKGKEVK